MILYGSGAAKHDFPHARSYGFLTSLCGTRIVPVPVRSAWRDVGHSFRLVMRSRGVHPCDSEEPPLTDRSYRTVSFLFECQSVNINPSFVTKQYRQVFRVEFHPNPYH